MLVSARVLDHQFFGSLAFERAGDFIAAGCRNNLLTVKLLITRRELDKSVVNRQRQG